MPQYRPYPKFLLFGDSLVEHSVHLMDGFSLAAALQSRYSRRMDVVNRGLSGYNTSQALEVLPEVIPPPSNGKIEYVLILFGANDAVIPDTTGQHVSLEEYKENIKTLITHPLIKAHHPRILLVTPPPIDEVQCEITDASRGWPLCRRSNITSSYASAVRDIGGELGRDLVVIDMWNAIMDAALKSTPVRNQAGPLLGSKDLGKSEALVNLMPDGLHLNGKGYAIFFREIVSAVQKKWPEIPPEQPSDAFIFPYWAKAPKLSKA